MGIKLKFQYYIEKVEWIDEEVLIPPPSLSCQCYLLVIIDCVHHHRFSQFICVAMET